MTEPFKITKQTTIVEKTRIILELDLELAKDLCALLDLVDTTTQRSRLAELWDKLDDALPDAPSCDEVFETTPGFDVPSPSCLRLK